MNFSRNRDLFIPDNPQDAELSADEGEEDLEAEQVSNFFINISLLISIE